MASLRRKPNTAATMSTKTRSSGTTPHTINTTKTRGGFVQNKIDSGAILQQQQQRQRNDEEGVLKSTTRSTTTTGVGSSCTLTHGTTSSPIIAPTTITTSSNRPTTTTPQHPQQIMRKRNIPCQATTSLAFSSSNNFDTLREEATTTRATRPHVLGRKLPLAANNSRYPSPSKHVEPSTQDVLKGRGEGLYNHEGNRFYRWIIKEKAFVYQSATKRQIKSDTIAEIYSEIQRRGGRFLVFDENVNQWHQMKESEAKKKISQSLRDEKKKRQNVASKSSPCEIVDDARSTTEYEPQQKVASLNSFVSSVSNIPADTFGSIPFYTSYESSRHRHSNYYDAISTSMIFEPLPIEDCHSHNQSPIQVPGENGRQSLSASYIPLNMDFSRMTGEKCDVAELEHTGFEQSGSMALHYNEDNNTRTINHRNQPTFVEQDLQVFPALLLGREGYLSFHDVESPRNTTTSGDEYILASFPSPLQEGEASSFGQQHYDQRQQVTNNDAVGSISDYNDRGSIESMLWDNDES